MRSWNLTASKTDAKILSCFPTFSSLESQKGPSEDSLSWSHVASVGSGGAACFPCSPRWSLAQWWGVGCQVKWLGGYATLWAWPLCPQGHSFSWWPLDVSLHVLSSTVRGNCPCSHQAPKYIEGFWGFWPALALLPCCCTLFSRDGPDSGGGVERKATVLTCVSLKGTELTA